MSNRAPVVNELLSRINNFSVEEATQHVDLFSQQLARQPWLAWKHVFALHRSKDVASATPSTDQFYEHFTAVMHTPEPSLPPLHLPPQLASLRSPYDGPITVEEIHAAVKGMSNHTARGPDAVPIEVFRCPEVCAALVPVLNRLFDDAQPHDDRILRLPPDLLDAFLTPVYKRKGDSREAKNHRPVVLLSHVLKIMDKILLLRLRSTIEPLLLKNQNAYRPSRSTIHHIVALSHLMWRAKKFRSEPLYALFVDFNRAFDSIPRDRLCATLLWFGCSERIVHWILATLVHQSLRLKSDTRAIRPTTGVMQGDTLAPFLFILCIDICLRSLPPVGVNISHPDVPSLVNSLAYADDIVLLANTAVGTQSLFSQLERSALMFGLTINVSKGKTELLIVGRDAPTFPVRTLAGSEVALTHSYKYLGWHLDTDLDWRTDFRRRLKQAWFITHSFSRIWTSSVPDDCKRRLFQATVLPVLTYAAFTYPSTAECWRELHTSCNALLRAALNTRVQWDNPDAHIHTERLYGTLPTLPALLTFHLLTAFGHWVRDDLQRDCEHVVFDVLLAPPPRAPRHKRGSAYNLRTHLTTLTQLPSFEDVVEHAQSKAAWSRTAHATARSVQLQFYESWILPRRLGGTTTEEHNRVISTVKRNWTSWSAKQKKRDYELAFRIRE